MERMTERDRTIALLAIGAATADAEMAAALKLDGIPDTSLRDFASAVCLLQAGANGQQKSDALREVTSFLSSVGITRSSSVTVRQQLVAETNRWAMYLRAMTWMRQKFKLGWLRPAGSRQDVIDRISELGFADE
jgi:hypothetical protein